MPSDRAYIEMSTVSRPHGSSNRAGYEDNGASSTTKLAGACHRCVDIFTYRLVQLVIVSIYLALLIHAVLNKGWWLYVNVSLGLGFTACVTAYFAIAFTAIRNLGHHQGRVFSWKIACLIDAMLSVLWGITFIAMCMPKGKDYKHLFEMPPYVAWYSAAFFSVLACGSYGASAYRISRAK